MTKTITFNDLRRIKDSLPDGSIRQIADRLNVTPRQYATTSEAQTMSLARIVVYTSNRDPTEAL